jgi:hypothetical protein
VAHPPDRAAIDTWAIRRICPDISDAQAAEILDLLRDEFAEERAEGFNEGRAAERQADE